MMPPMLDPIVPPGASAIAADANNDGELAENASQRFPWLSITTAGYISDPPTRVMSTSRSTVMLTVEMWTTRRQARVALSVRYLHASFPAAHRLPLDQTADSSLSSPVASCGLPAPGCSPPGGDVVLATPRTTWVKFTALTPGTPVNAITPTDELL